MCGVFGVIGVNNAASLVVAGLHTLQHRAHDFGGICSVDSHGQFRRRRGNGLITTAISPEELKRLQGNMALGHIRYPTVADTNHDDDIVNIQPLKGRLGRSQIAIAHNGSLTQLETLHDHVSPSRLTTSLDTEYILRLIEQHGNEDIAIVLKEILPLLSGSYSLGLLTDTHLIAVRDPSGNRPLSIGKFPAGGYCVTSETCALSNVGATFEMDVEPGTIAVISADEYKVVRFAEPTKNQCRFEAVYIASPASRVFGEDVDEARIKIGIELAKSAPVPGVDIIVPVPDSSNFMALGFAREHPGGEYLPAILRNHYIGRTFIEPTQELRETGVARKFLFSEHAIRGKKIVVLDDSIVRGTTIQKIVNRLWELGALEVHVRIGFPPILFPCLYGVDTREKNELILNTLSQEQLREQIKATTLEFLSLPSLEGLSNRPQDFCYACVNGKYWD